MDKECSFIIKHIFKIRMNDNLASLISSMNGLLLYGPPGTGKSLLASAIAKQWEKLKPELEVMYVKGPALFSKMVGETEEKLREVFTCPSGKSKLVIVDEIDSLFPSRSGGEQNALNNRVVSQFLSVMDGLEKVSNIFVVGTSNRKDSIDPAVLRNGRLGLHLQVTYQNKES
jgi:SpoVK/Ycf46/Vps4 family AAA+-type ATPase